METWATDHEPGAKTSGVRHVEVKFVVGLQYEGGQKGRRCKVLSKTKHGDCDKGSL
jgi:hypothetical protein